MENTGLTIFLIISTFLFTLCHPMATTHMYNKLQDTSIYINLSSQNLHSAIAALKREAKPLTTLNIKGFWRHKKEGVKRRGIRRDGEWRDRVRGRCQGLKTFFWIYKKK